MKYPLTKRVEIIQAYVKQEISKQQARDMLRCSNRTIERQMAAFIAFGKDGLVDHRHSNHYKLSDQERTAVMGGI